MKNLIVLLIITLFTLVCKAEPITIVTTSGPGSLSDTVVRYFVPELEKELNSSIVVKNVPGANGLIGLRHFYTLPPDSSILISSTVVPYVSFKYKGEVPDPITNLASVMGLSYSPQQILVPGSSDVHTVKDLVALYRKKGYLNGGTSHPSTSLSLNQLDTSIGIVTTHINYKLGSQLAVDTSSGILDYTLGAYNNSANQALIASGRLRSIGLLSQLNLQGYKNVEEFSWTGVSLNATTTPNFKNTIELAFKKVLATEYANKAPQKIFKATASDLDKLIRLEHSIIEREQ